MVIVSGAKVSNCTKAIGRPIGILITCLYLCLCVVVAGAWAGSQRDLGLNTSPVVCVALGKSPTFSEPASSIKQGLTGGRTWKGHGSTLAHLHLLRQGLLACLEGRYRATSQYMPLGSGARCQMSVKGFE